MDPLPQPAGFALPAGASSLPTGRWAVRCGAVFRFQFLVAAVLAVYCGLWPQNMRALAAALPDELVRYLAHALFVGGFWIGMIVLTLASAAALLVWNCLPRRRTATITVLALFQLLPLVAFIPRGTDIPWLAQELVVLWSLGLCATCCLCPLIIVGTLYPWRRAQGILCFFVVCQATVYSATVLGIAGAVVGNVG